ncbi:MAG: hypothetical protein Tsb0015_11570 [Simkaniaceae bacterium]
MSLQIHSWDLEDFFLIPQEPAIASDFFQKVVMGANAFILEFPLSILGSFSSIKILEAFDIECLENQNVKEVFDELISAEANWPATIIKIVFISYICLIGPIFEEYIFREEMQTNFKDFQKDSDSVHHKILRVAFNGCIFGACHLHPSQGWANVPIFVATSIGGIFYSALRERTEDITASSTAHILHNSAATLHWLLV